MNSMFFFQASLKNVSLISFQIKKEKFKKLHSVVALYRNAFWTFLLLKVKVKSFSHIQLFETLWTVARQAPLSMGFSSQEHWSGLPCPAPEDLPDPGIEPASLMSPALAGGFFATSATWEAQLWPPTLWQFAHLEMAWVCRAGHSWGLGPS